MLDLQPAALVPADAPPFGAPTDRPPSTALTLEALPVGGRLLSLRLPAGEIALLEGGATAERLRVLCIAAGLGFRGPGQCLLNGVSTRRLDGPARQVLRQRHVGRVLAIDTLPEGLSVRGAVAVPLLAQGVAPHAAFERATRLLEALGPGVLPGQRCEQLGPRARHLALLARALVASPTLVVLEDLGSVLLPEDAPAVRAVLRVAAAVEGCSVLMTSHEPRLAGLADRRVHLAGVRG